MAQPKPSGLTDDYYAEAQKLKAEEDFKVQANDRIQKLEFALDEVTTDLNEVFALQYSYKTEIAIKFENLMESTISALKDFRTEINVLSSELQKHKEALVEAKKNQLFYVELSEFNETKSLNNTAMVKLLAVQDAMRHEFNSTIQRLSIDTSAKMKALKEEILAIPSQVPEVKRSIEEQIQLVEINCQNAVLRSGNNEKQLMLVDRKIDNLYQLVKQIQLANQDNK